MNYQEILEAREILGLSERASLAEIKARYRQLLHQWHPDTCSDDKEECAAMIRKINAAYINIQAYCNQYRYSFAEEEVKKYAAAEEWWQDRFGNDPLWGKS